MYFYVYVIPRVGIPSNGVFRRFLVRDQFTKCKEDISFVWMERILMVLRVSHYTNPNF